MAMQDVTYSEHITTGDMRQTVSRQHHTYSMPPMPQLLPIFNCFNLVRCVAQVTSFSEHEQIENKWPLNNNLLQKSFYLQNSPLDIAKYTLLG